MSGSTEGIADFRVHLPEGTNVPATIHYPGKYTEVFSTSKKVIGVAYAILLIGGFVCVVGMYTHMLSPSALHAILHLSKEHALIIGAVALVMIAGGGVVIQRARATQDPLIERHIFQSRDMGAYIQEATIIDHKGNPHYDYIDTSTLDENKSGKAYLYSVKRYHEHYGVSANVSVVTILIEMVGKIVYHAIRMCVVPFYVLVCLGIEAVSGEPLFDGQGFFEKKAVLVEPWNSLLYILTTPFYAAAITGCALYSFVNPMGGRILGAKVARDWNGEVPFAEGIWSVKFAEGIWPVKFAEGIWSVRMPLMQGYEPLWDGFNEFGPKKLGQFKFFGAGCWQPVGVVECEAGVITSAYSLTKAVSSKNQTEDTVIRGHDLTIYPLQSE